MTTFYSFVLCLFLLSGSMVAQNVYDYTAEDREESKKMDTIKNNSVFEIGFTFQPYSFNQTEVVFDGSELIYEDIKYILAARSGNLNMLNFGMKLYYGDEKQYPVHFGLNLHASERLNLFNVELTTGRSWRPDPMGNPALRFNVNFGINISQMGMGIDDNLNEAGLAQGNFAGLTTVEFFLPVYKTFSLFVRGSASLPLYSWKSISFPIEDEVNENGRDRYTPYKNEDILTMDSDGRRMFNVFFWVTTGFSFAF